MFDSGHKRLRVGGPRSHYAAALPRLLKSARDWTRGQGEPRSANYPGEGHLVRFDPAGGQLENLATGLRNPFGIAFNTDGEMFTYDDDAEFDIRAPWYRPTRGKC